MITWKAIRKLDNWIVIFTLTTIHVIFSSISIHHLQKIPTWLNIISFFIKMTTYIYLFRDLLIKAWLVLIIGEIIISTKFKFEVAFVICSDLNSHSDFLTSLIGVCNDSISILPSWGFMFFWTCKPRITWWIRFIEILEIINRHIIGIYLTHKCHICLLEQFGSPAHHKILDCHCNLEDYHIPFSTLRL